MKGIMYVNDIIEVCNNKIFDAHVLVDFQFDTVIKRPGLQNLSLCWGECLKKFKVLERILSCQNCKYKCGRKDFWDSFEFHNVEHGDKASSLERGLSFSVRWGNRWRMYLYDVLLCAWLIR